MSRPMKGYIFKRKFLGGKERILDVSDDTSATYWVQYSVGGKRRVESLGTSDYETAKERWEHRKTTLGTITDEQKYLRKLIEEGEAAKRKLYNLEHGGTGILVQDAFNKYLASKRRRAGTKDRTLKGYRQQFDRFVRWAPGTIKQVRDLTPSLCERYVQDLDDCGINAHTVNKHIGLLELVWKTVDPTWPNPWAGLHSTRLHTISHYRRLTLDECKAIYAKATGEYKLLVLLGYSTGQRIGDLATLQWNQVDVQEKTLSLSPAKTDRRKPKTIVIPMTEQLADAIGKTGKKAVMPMLCASYRADNSAIVKALSGLFEKCGVKDNAQGVASFHSFRHTFASMLTDAGASLQIQATLTSHTLPGVVGTYTHPAVSVLRDWINKAIPKL